MVPYQGSAPAMLDLIEGRVQVAMDTVAVTQAYIKSGKLKLLAVASPRRLPQYPYTPTIAELGFPIVNDPLYGEVIDVDYFERQTFDNHDDPEDARRWIALHSSTLSFDHPTTGVRLTLEAPPWGDFGELLGRLHAAHQEKAK